MKALLFVLFGVSAFAHTPAEATSHHQTLALGAPRLLSPRLLDQRQWQFHYPKPVPYRFGFSPTLRRLTDLGQSSRVLDGVPVEAPFGKWAGRIKAVATDSSGTPTRVEIALNKRVAVVVQPGSLRFDMHRHIAFTDISSGTLWHLPSAVLIPS